jgi:hypothetical protein
MVQRRAFAVAWLGRLCDLPAAFGNDCLMPEADANDRNPALGQPDEVEAAPGFARRAGTRRQHYGRMELDGSSQRFVGGHIVAHHHDLRPRRADGVGQVEREAIAVVD